MFDELYDVDWSSLHHAYGSAEDVPAWLSAMRSGDAEERGRALREFSNKVFHQGTVVTSTTASLPFLFELAEDTTTPDRAAIVAMLVNIGIESVDNCETEYADEVDFAGSARIVRNRAEAFVAFASDPDSLVRRAAIPGLGWFLDDADEAAAVLRVRLPAESGVLERVLVVEAMASLALRLPGSLDGAMAWFAMLAADPSAGPETRLAALVQRARCVPGQIGEDLIPAVINLLGEMTHFAPDWARHTAPLPKPATSGAPPHILAIFEDLDSGQRLHAPTTEVLRTLHRALEARVPERTALLIEQMRSRDPGTRLDALRMSADLMKSWRGDHTTLITLVAEHLDETVEEVAAEAAIVLESCHAIAEPAKEALAAYVVGHGPDEWTAPGRHLRRAHQEAVRALARLGDGRAVPSVLVGLDSGIDTWRAIQVAGRLPEAADQLVPRLCHHLRQVDLTGQFVEMTVQPILFALSALRNEVAVPLVTDILVSAFHREQWSIASAALQALKAIGASAAPALEVIRPLVAVAHTNVRGDAVAALWAIGCDREEVMPLLLDLLHDPSTSSASAAADVLGEIGTSAVRALPRLRELLMHSYEWVRVPCAAAVWDIGGDVEAATVLDVLLTAWEQNPSTGNHVVTCLDRMGATAEPALPQLRSQLALPRRGGRYGTIDADEELQRIMRTLIDRLSAAR